MMVVYQRIPMEKKFTSYYIDNHVNNHLKNMHTALVALNKSILSSCLYHPCLLPYRLNNDS